MKRQKLSDKMLKLLAEKYPTKEIVYEKLIYLEAQLELPKGTEHFMSDLHGEYTAFFHILNNCSGVIREKVEYLFGGKLTREEKSEFCTLIYYPVEKNSAENFSEKRFDRMALHKFSAALGTFKINVLQIPRI